MAELTKVTSQVLAANSVIETKLANDSIGDRQIIAGSITQDKLPSTANASIVQANLTSNVSELMANDYNSYTTITGVIDTVQSNLTSLISGATEFTAAQKIFQKDVIVQGNLTVTGATFNAAVTEITSNDSTFTLNWNGTDATAELAGFQIAGTNNALLANLQYSSSSLSKFRVGAGSLTSADDLARTSDYQANDSITHIQLTANINSVQSNLTTFQGTALTPFNNTSTSTGSNVFFVQGPNNATDANSVFVSLDGLHQPKTGWVYSPTNDTVQFKDVSIPTGIVFDVTSWIFNV